MIDRFSGCFHSRLRAVGVLLLLLSCHPASAQSGPTVVSALPYLSEHPPRPVLTPFTWPWSHLFTFKSPGVRPPAAWRNLLHVSAERPFAYAADELAFFCRLEVKLEKATRLPVRFRLGDVQAVDYLEGKFSGWRYGY